MADRLCHIAEIGVNHDGKIEEALDFLDALASFKTPPDFVKFQYFDAKSLSAVHAQTATYQTEKAISQRELLAKLELALEEIQMLIERANSLELKLMISPFGKDALSRLLDVGVQNVKIASGEAFDYELLNELRRVSGQVVVSTGMSSLSEIRSNIEYAEQASPDPFIILHCVSSYPTPLNQTYLGTIRWLLQNFPMHQVGLSDHTLGFEAALCSLGMGATCFEKHITFDPSRKGPDHAMSMCLADYDRYIRLTHELSESINARRPQDKFLSCEADVAAIARKSLRASMPIKSGDRFGPQNIEISRPFDGACASTLSSVISTTARRDYEAGEAILIDE